MYRKKCGGEKHVKARFISGEQRYLCKERGCKFVPTRKKGKFGFGRLILPVNYPLIRSKKIETQTYLYQALQTAKTLECL